MIFTKRTGTLDCVGYTTGEVQSSKNSVVKGLHCGRSFNAGYRERGQTVSVCQSVIRSAMFDRSCCACVKSHLKAPASRSYISAQFTACVADIAVTALISERMNMCSHILR